MHLGRDFISAIPVDLPLISELHWEALWYFKNTFCHKWKYSNYIFKMKLCNSLHWPVSINVCQSNITQRLRMRGAHLVLILCISSLNQYLDECLLIQIDTDFLNCKYEWMKSSLLSSPCFTGANADLSFTLVYYTTRAILKDNFLVLFLFYVFGCKWLMETTIFAISSPRSCSGRRGSQWNSSCNVNNRTVYGVEVLVYSGKCHCS